MKLTPELKRAAFLALLKQERIPPPQKEFVFSDKRKFAADYYWDINGVKLMLELQGGVDGVKISGHTSILGMKRDREKLNLASTHHIFTMQVSYRELTLPATILQIKKILKLC